MFSLIDLKGSNLPDKTLCLTFDDGPGSSSNVGSGSCTQELAEYLFEEEIIATFFMVGKFISEFPDITAKVKNLGHIIGNHTYFHHNLIEYYKDKDGSIINKEGLINDISCTEELLKKHDCNSTIYFRAPYGMWDKDIANYLNNNLVSSNKYIGPIHWDIEGKDYDYWLKNDVDSAEQCEKKYIDQLIGKNMHGIILMHDSCADDNCYAEIRRSNNKILESVKLMIPKLKKDGYTFIGIDKISF